MSTENIKHLLVEHLKNDLQNKSSHYHSALIAAKESQENDTKSSAGDKFETGREMIQIEIDKIESQIAKTNQLSTNLKQVDLTQIHNKVEFGSVVVSNQGKYFIAIPYGKCVVQGQSYFVISLASPIGKMLFGKSVGDPIIFQGKEFFIEHIY